MFKDKEFLKKRNELLTRGKGCRWAELKKLEAEYDRNHARNLRKEQMRDSLEFRGTLDKFKYLTEERKKMEAEMDREEMEKKKKEQEEQEQYKQYVYEGIKKKIDQRLVLGKYIGNNLDKFENKNKRHPATSDNMAILADSPTLMTRRRNESLKHHQLILEQMGAKKREKEQEREKVNQERKQYLVELSKEQDKEKLMMQQRVEDEKNRYQFLKKQVEDRDKRRDHSDNLSKEELKMNRYWFTTRPPYI